MKNSSTLLQKINKSQRQQKRKKIINELQNSENKKIVIVSPYLFIITINVNELNSLYNTSSFKSQDLHMNIS